ncbi:RTX-I toxin determinant A from serotypes 1/9 [Prochlorococcus marinus str. MIT 1320]|nr:RTX-I toxin determinant A from serotypes 1/9 [Prochlorococcus marinus str. MIT 1320]
MNNRDEGLIPATREDPSKAFLTSNLWYGEGEFYVNGRWLSGNIRYFGSFDSSSQAAFLNSRVDELRLSVEELGYLSFSGMGLSVSDFFLTPGNIRSLVYERSNVINCGSYDDMALGYSGSDQIYGYSGNDLIHGNHGPDIVDGGIGNDILRGGHGHDDLRGGAGLDFLWGGQGSNVLSAGIDSVKDDLYVPVDSVVNPAGNPGGANRDFLTQVTSADRIYMHGIDDEALTYVAGVLDPRGSGLSGVGIYANGILEAIVHDSSGLSVSQVNNITIGGVFA